MALGTPVIGTAVYGSGATLNIAYPASVGANDQLLMICLMRPAVAAGGSFTPPAGWTTFASLIDKGGYGATTGSDIGNMNIWIASKDALASGGETGSLTASVGGNGVSAGVMVRVPTGGGRLTFDATGGEKTAAGASISVACSNDPGIKASDLLVWAMAIPTDVSTPTQFGTHSVTATGVTIGSATELVEFDTTIGNDLGGYAAWASCSAGSSSGVPTIAATAAGTTTNVRGPLALLVVREGGTVLDRFNKSQYLTVYGGDLTVESNVIHINGGARIRSTTTKSDNRYVEAMVLALNSTENLIGVCNSSLNITGGYGQYDANFTGISTNGGAVYVNGSYAGAGPTFGVGDVVSQQIDPANGIRWRVNGGTWSSWYALPSGSAWYLCAMLTPLATGQDRQVWNLGATAFAYTEPSGSVGWDATPAGTPAGRADEADTAYALTRVQITAVGSATETDSATARPPVQLRATGLATTTDTAYTLAAKQILTTGRADEADTAYALTLFLPGTPVGLASEADSAGTLAAIQIRATGLATESNAAYALGRAIPAQRANETDLVTARPAVQILPVGLASTTDSAFARTVTIVRPIVHAEESDTATARPSVQILPTGRANETDVALNLTSGQSTPVGTAFELSTAYALTPRQLKGTSLATESNTSFARTLTILLPTQRADEVDTAYARAVGQGGPVGLATETNAATARPPLQLRLTGLASSIETSLALIRTILLPVGRATTTDQAFALSQAQTGNVQRATELNQALSLSFVHARPTGLSLETDLAFQLLSARPITPDSRALPESRRTASIAEIRRSASIQEQRISVSQPENRSSP